MPLSLWGPDLLLGHSYRFALVQASLELVFIFIS